MGQQQAGCCSVQRNSQLEVQNDAPCQAPATGSSGYAVAGSPDTPSLTFTAGSDSVPAGKERTHIRLRTLGKTSTLPRGRISSVSPWYRKEKLQTMSSAQTGPLFTRGEESEDEVSELDEEPAEFVSGRRGGVSAEATGAHNRVFAEWEPPVFEKTPAQRDMLIDVLSECPFLAGADYDTLSSLADASYIKAFEAGECLHEQGEVGRTGYMLLSGFVTLVKHERKACDGTPRPSTCLSSCSVETAHPSREGTVATALVEPGRFFGEHTMLWGFRRENSAYAQEACVLAKIKRDVFFNLVTRKQMKERSLLESFLRKIPMFDTLDDEMIALTADAVNYQKIDKGEAIIRQGDPGKEIYVVMRGECVATVATGSDDHLEHRRYHQGDRFGELAFLKATVRGATVSAVTDVEVVMLTYSAFKRLFGSLGLVQKEQYMNDPRKTIADFYRPGSRDGPRGVSAPDHRGTTHWFAVYRPTSRDAITKMLTKVAVGKGLNIKGKSSKKNHLSGYVPFLQISNNDHKSLIEQSPPDARVKIFYQSAESRKLALQKLLPHIAGGAASTDIWEDKRFEQKGQFGLNVPEFAVREAYIIEPDISFLMGWETGRQSEPAFMDMNLHCVRGTSEPEVVLYQYDQDNCMNPHGLLIGYAESSVKPVVSDFDTFTVGSKGMSYEPLAPDQCQLANWSLDNTLEILQSPGTSAWNTRWLDVLRRAAEEGFHPEVPKYGFGDVTSVKLIKAVVDATMESGAVRHGSECFNFGFPQEMDPEYLVVWEGYDDAQNGKPWQYVLPGDLQKFLIDRIEEGFRFPINPVWAVRDQGWYEVYEKLKVQTNGSDGDGTFRSWFPRNSGLQEKIEAMHQQFPQGFRQLEDAADEVPFVSDVTADMAGTGGTSGPTILRNSIRNSTLKSTGDLPRRNSVRNSRRASINITPQARSDDGALGNEEHSNLIAHAASAMPGTRKWKSLRESFSGERPVLIESEWTEQSENLKQEQELGLKASNEAITNMTK